MRSTDELIEAINQYEADDEDLCELGDEVVLLAQALIDSGNLTDALNLMGVYTEEAEWPNYGADGYWAEHTKVVDMLLNLGMNHESVDAGSIVVDFMNYPLYFRIGVTINPRLQSSEVESILENLTNGEPCDSFDWEDQFIAVGLLLNQNLINEVFVKYFRLMDSETLEYVLSLAQGSAYTWGWLFEYPQEFMANSKNIEQGKKRILDYIANSDPEFITPTIRYSDVNLGSKDDIISAIDIG